MRITRVATLLTIGAGVTVFLTVGAGVMAAPSVAGAQSQDAPTGSLRIEKTTVGGAGTFEFLVDCTTGPLPADEGGGPVLASSATVQTATLAVGADATGVVTVDRLPAGLSCTVSEIVGAGATLTAVAGGGTVHLDDGTLVGGVTVIVEDSTSTLGFTNTFPQIGGAPPTAPEQSEPAEVAGITAGRSATSGTGAATLPATGPVDESLVVVALGLLATGTTALAAANRGHRDDRTET